MTRRNNIHKIQLLMSTAILLSATTLVTSARAQETAPTAQDDRLETVVVTGSTSKNRKLITSSVDATVASAADIARKSPRSIADILELVPGIFVEGTAGGVSNNYSVRGLQGGGQRFVQLEEDGMPVIYGGGGADEFFSHDITVDRVEAVRGGTSGILGVNGAGATINFISKRPNFNQAETIVRLTGASYGLKRADFYYSAPLAQDLAFSIGGYMSSNPGVRKSGVVYDSYHLKAQVEKRWDDGTYLVVAARTGDQQDAYYATYPHAVGPKSVNGFDQAYDNIAGPSFANIKVPVSCQTENFGSAPCLRTFDHNKGIQAKTNQIRFNFYKPLSENLNLFAKGRYLAYKWDFNGLFPGSGTGNGGLASINTYLNGGAASPVNNVLTAGAVAFPTATRFGLKNLTTGQIIASNNTAAFSNLNGNGLIQQTTLNHDYKDNTDLGLNFGARYDSTFGDIKNSLTVGMMYYKLEGSKNQSAVTRVLNDVKNASDLYDLVALDSNNTVVGLLTNDGKIDYGNWGQGLSKEDLTSVSVYFNNEMQINDKLRVDFGVRQEKVDGHVFVGNQASVNQAVPAGTVGLAQTVGATFNGTYTKFTNKLTGTATTIGANYLFSPSFSVYGRYAKGFQMGLRDTNAPFDPTTIALYEAGVRYKGHGLLASATVFRTDFKKQFYGYFDPVNPAINGGFEADLQTNGFEIDASYRFNESFRIDGFGVFQKPELSSVKINNIAFPSFNGNVPERTPKTLITVTPSYSLPNNSGELYARFKYIGEIFADSGNGLALPSYTVVSIGGNYNITPNMNFNLSIDNLTNEIGLTEGNPRQGATQSVANGFFYGRGIVGRNAIASITLRY
jgi:iron complex outermembrane recepter protein